ncbi:hypothetical protein [Streptomyces canus]|uniref:hypothetical protein n=1 Tax=Streptomyces canus TaxID=58343 RepID=UPI00036B45E1|nr:hypothetical protein [Streptomyces canus]
MPTDEPSGGSGINWAHWSTVISTTAAGVGLLLTAVVTYFGVVTARDQLNQSREARDDKAAQQASLVTNWTSQNKDGDLVEIVANRSLDPVLGAYIKIPIRKAVSKSLTQIGSSAWLIGQIPPCTSLTVEPKRVTEAEGEVTLVFTDSSGQAWERSSTGSLSHGKADRPFVAPGKPASRIWKTSPLKECGTN